MKIPYFCILVYHTSRKNFMHGWVSKNEKSGTVMKQGSSPVPVDILVDILSLIRS